MARGAAKKIQSKEGTVRADDAVAKLPKSAEECLKIFSDLRELKSEVQGAAGDVSSKRKEIETRYMLDKAAISMVEKALSLPQGRREMVIHQARYLFDKLNLTPQGVLPGLGLGEDEEKSKPKQIDAFEENKGTPGEDGPMENKIGDGEPIDDKVVPIKPLKPTAGLNPKEALAALRKANADKKEKDAKKDAAKASASAKADKYIGKDGKKPTSSTPLDDLPSGRAH